MCWCVCLTLPTTLKENFFEPVAITPCVPTNCDPALLVFCADGHFGASCMVLCLWYSVRCAHGGGWWGNWFYEERGDMVLGRHPCRPSFFGIVSHSSVHCSQISQSLCHFLRGPLRPPDQGTPVLDN